MSIRNSLIGLLFFCFSSLISQELEISFVIKNAGIPVEVSFTESELEFDFDMQNLSGSFFNATVEVESINSGIKSRDRHLLKEKYFYLDKYPEMTFRSTRVYEAENMFMVQGDLTIKGVTKKVEIPVKAIRNENGVGHLTGEFTLDRRDYGVGRNHLILADEVKVMLKLMY